MTSYKDITISPADDDQRLDRWVRRECPHIGQGLVQKLLRKKQIRLNGKRAQASSRIHTGDVVRVPPAVQETQDEKKPKIKPKVSAKDKTILQGSVLFEDDHILVINKPHGLAVQGGSGTLRHVDGMLHIFAADGAQKPRLVHRLDKDTSGVLVLARTRKMATQLTELFKQHKIRKTYWALICGKPSKPKGTIDAAMAKSTGEMQKMQLDDEAGQDAVTHYRLCDNIAAGDDGNLSWLELMPLSGRTHQLRVHCAEFLAPIVGDGKYGRRDQMPRNLPDARKLHLHARKIEFVHPVTGKQMEIVAPLPDHIQKSFTTLGFEIL